MPGNKQTSHSHNHKLTINHKNSSSINQKQISILGETLGQQTQLLIIMQIIKGIVTRAVLPVSQKLIKKTFKIESYTINNTLIIITQTKSPLNWVVLQYLLWQYQALRLIVVWLSLHKVQDQKLLLELLIKVSKKTLSTKEEIL